MTSQSSPATHLNQPPPLAEKTFTVIVLLLSTGAFLNLGIQSGQSPDESSGMLGMQVVWSVIYLITLVLLLRHCKACMKSFLHEPLLVGLVALAALSTLWSAAPGLTIRRAVALLFTCLFGLYLARRYTLKEQLQLLAWMCGLVAVFSFVFQALNLGAAVDRIQGPWIGVFVQKNDLGRMMTLSILVFIFLGKVSSEQKGLAWASGILSLVLLAMSQSRTALVVLALLFLLFPLCNVLRRSLARAFVGLSLTGVLGTIAVVWVATNWDVATEALGRNMTLTGRLTIWVLSFVMALRRPWLGYGYNAFWLSGAESARIWSAVGWSVPHAHNGFLEIWLELGLVGLALYLFGFLAYLRRAVRFLRRTSNPAAAWPFLFLGFVFLSNLTESSLLARNTIFVILYASIVFATAQASAYTLLKSETPCQKTPAPRLNGWQRSPQY